MSSAEVQSEAEAAERPGVPDAWSDPDPTVPKYRVAREGRNGVEPRGRYRRLMAPRTRWRYARTALTSPWHLLALTGVVCAGVACWNAVAPVLGVLSLDILVLVVVVRLRAFRRHVDARIEHAAQKCAAERRAGLIAMMCEDHRKELASLETIVENARDANRPQGAAGQAIVDECLSLLARYVRIAISYNVGKRCQACVDRTKVENDSRTLEAMSLSGTPRTRDLARRSLSVARERLDRWDRSQETLQALTLQLKLIADLLRLMHEQLSAPPNPDSDTAAIDDLFNVMDRSRSAADELGPLLTVDYEVDPYELDVGRSFKPSR